MASGAIMIPRRVARRPSPFAHCSPQRHSVNLETVHVSFKAAGIQSPTTGRQRLNTADVAARAGMPSAGRVGVQAGVQKGTDHGGRIRACSLGATELLSHVTVIQRSQGPPVGFSELEEKSR
jgi:hypothetical protein